MTEANNVPELTNLKNFNEEELRAQFKSWGIPAFRATQVYQWIWRQRACNLDEMQNLPKKMRAELKQKTCLPQIDVAEQSLARDGTRKLLVGLTDGKRVESVIIPDEERRTLCLSTQVGCAMGCQFCRTATMGLIRHLEPWEIVDQVLLAEEILTAAGDGRVISGGPSQRSKVQRRLTNLVFMGMGEPLHNIDNVISAIKILTDDKGLDFPPRRITVSSVGLVNEARRLIDETGVRLAFSLNAPDDERRNQIMPVNKRFEIKEIMDFVLGLPLKKSERVTFEYVMLRDFNDRPGDEQLLANWLRPLNDRAKINLIPFNFFEESGFQTPLPERVESFRRNLINKGVRVTIRRARGLDILAACGQLAYKRQQSVQSV